MNLILTAIRRTTITRRGHVFQPQSTFLPKYSLLLRRLRHSLLCMNMHDFYSQYRHIRMDGDGVKRRNKDFISSFSSFLNPPAVKLSVSPPFLFFLSSSGEKKEVEESLRSLFGGPGATHQRVLNPRFFTLLRRLLSGRPARPVKYSNCSPATCCVLQKVEEEEEECRVGVSCVARHADSSPFIKMNQHA